MLHKSQFGTTTWVTVKELDLTYDTSLTPLAAPMMNPSPTNTDQADGYQFSHLTSENRTPERNLRTRRQLLVLWFLISSVAAAMCSLTFIAARMDGEYVPVGNDSFYHARRILDTVENPSGFYEFDTRIHAPEGSLLTWPWGYDYFVAQLIRAGLWMHDSADPMALMTWLPVVAVFISVGLVMLISRQLGLSIGLTVLAGLCVALSPLTQYLHGAGIIDHHFAEYIFVLSAIAVSLNWLNNLRSAKAAILVGMTMGVAPAVHNGLFVIQIPLVVTLLALWSQGIRLPQKTSGVFSVTLLASTFAILLPSLPFRTFRFEFYLLSWFHAYIAFGTASLAYLTSRIRCDRRGILTLAGTGLILLLPIVGQMIYARTFLAGEIVRLDRIGEMQSVRQLARGLGGLDAVSNFYSLLMWITPFTTIYCAVRSWEDRQSYRLVFWITCLCGLAMMITQFRLHYFGSFALYLPWLVFAQKRLDTQPHRKKLVHLVATLIFILAYSYPLRYQLVTPMTVGNDPSFSALRPVLRKLADSCEKEPGIVLADADAGHYIRYYTRCSVIANNFLLTKQHEEKIHLIDALFDMTPQALTTASPRVSYVLVRPMGITRTSERGFRYMAFGDRASVLLADLLMKDATTAPRQFELLYEAKVGTDETSVPYARLYRLHSAN